MPDRRSRRRSQRGGRRQPSERIGRLDEAYLEAMAQLRGDETRPTPSPPGQDVPAGAFADGDAQVQVIVDEDGMTATLTRLVAGGRIDVDQVRDALARTFGVVAGVEERTLADVVERANQLGQVEGPIVIARGTPPVAGEDGRIRFLFVPGADEEEPRLPFADLAQALSETRLDDVLGQAVFARMVTPGERIAVRVPPAQACLVTPDTPLARRLPASPGTAGHDVFGNELQLPGREAHLEAGNHVLVEGDEFRAEIYGYVCLLGDEIAVLPPLWISPDRMEAHFIHFPEVSDPRSGAAGPPDPAWIRAALDAVGVRHGILDEAVSRLGAEPIPPRTRTSVLVARGTSPRRGRDTHIDFAVDYEKRAGRIREDGSIDLRERNSVVAVVDGQLLGELSPATPGEAGCDVTGTALPAEDGVDREFRAGDHVRQAEEGGVIRFYAALDGAVYLDAGALRVNPVVSISGDIDYDSGNIEVDGDVHISGDVRSGFSVRAGGSVSVGGVIEAGATVNARGDVVASKGIVGERTRVVALGSVETRYVQNASVMAGGDITVGSYVFSGSLRAGGRISVRGAGGERGGSIVGGECLATGGIRALRIGSPETDRTVVGIGSAPEVTIRLAQLRDAIEDGDRQVRRLCHVAGVELPEPGAEEPAAASLARRRHPDAAQLADRLRALGARRRQAVAEQQQLEQTVAAALRQERIEVEDTVYADVLLRFGSRNSAVAEDIGPSVFYLTEGGIRWRPRQP